MAATVTTAILIMTGIGLIFGVVLAVAWRFLRVEEDPRLDQLEEMLPGTNCGACGTPGCRAFAQALLNGEAVPASCTVSSPAEIKRIAERLGVDAGSVERRVARLHCGGGKGLAVDAAQYLGLSSCRAAALVNGGGRACNWGCLGLADCEEACTFDAISMNRLNLPEVDPDRCTACNDCVEICPKDLFTLEPVGQPLVVACNSPLTGPDARSGCAVACDACGRCVSDAPEGVLAMKDGLPVVLDPERTTADAIWRCPTGAIQWLSPQTRSQPEKEPAEVS
ncbi:MAG: RnfABCDGE type electron transport complex subunit B [Acidobacteriota bacterium]|nr:RnfABCDGE type electron transport complex subunit B [Acidobacteriota bacterium]